MYDFIEQCLDEAVENVCPICGFTEYNCQCTMDINSILLG